MTSTALTPSECQTEIRIAPLLPVQHKGKLRVASVGLGWVASNRHLPAMQRSGDFDVVGAIDRRPGRAAQLMSRWAYRHAAATADLSTVDWLDEVDIVTVATSPAGHYPTIRQALELGKHVLTEKPFAMTVAQGEELVALSQARGLCLGIVHNFQFARSTKQLLCDMARGALGPICSVSAIQLGNPGRRLPEWYEQLPLGLFYDESPHLLYLLRRVVGDFALRDCLIHRSSKGLNTPARVDAYFDSPTFQGPITLSCNFESPVSEWYLMVFGEKKLGVIDVFRDIYISLPNDRSHDAARVLRTTMCFTGQQLWQHIISGIGHITGSLLYGNVEVFTRFAQAVRGDFEALDSIGPENALAVLKLQHAIIAGRRSPFGQQSL
jgi:predicted dehydrogenase